MEWYYAEGRQQRGPVSAEEFQRLVKDGTVRADTLVWREGMSNWQPYGQVVQTSPPELVSEGGLVCSQCGRAFPVGEVTHHGEGWICGSCKPPAMGLSGEGAGALSGEEGAVSVDELLARDYTVDTGDYFSRSLELLRNNAGLLIGATALIYLVMIAVSIIPYLSMILSLIFTGPLMGGLWLLYIRVTRGEVVSVGDAFAGFGPSFVQLLLANAVTGILSGLCLLPAFLVMIVAAVGSEFSQQGGGGAVGEFVGGGMLFMFVVLMGLGLVGYVYLAVCWLFALPIVADKGLSFWPAMSLSWRMVTKHWWGTFLLGLAVVALVTVGFLLCGVGVLVTGPLAMGMLAFHYEKVLGDLQTMTA